MSPTTPSRIWSRACTIGGWNKSGWQTESSKSLLLGQALQLVGVLGLEHKGFFHQHVQPVLQGIARLLIVHIGRAGDDDPVQFAPEWTRASIIAR